MTTEIKKGRGRPRVFDMDQALDKALEIFWEKGYEGASLAELTQALGINKPSMYAAFGNKEALFKKALERYSNGPVVFINEVIKEPTAYDVAKKFLHQSARFLTETSHPKGCMIVQAALSSGESAHLIKETLINYRTSYEAMLSDRLQRAQNEGDLPVGTNPKCLAKFLATLHQGMSVQATSGATEADLTEMADMALNLWPK